MRIDYLLQVLGGMCLGFVIAGLGIILGLGVLALLGVWV